MPGSPALLLQCSPLGHAPGTLSPRSEKHAPGQPAVPADTPADASTYCQPHWTARLLTVRAASGHDQHLTAGAWETPRGIIRLSLSWPHRPRRWQQAAVSHLGARGGGGCDTVRDTVSHTHIDTPFRWVSAPVSSDDRALNTETVLTILTKSQTIFP